MQDRGQADGEVMESLYEHHAEMCKVFSHPTRLKILNILRKRELAVATIAEVLGMALGTVSPHLLLMKRRRVLRSRKQGNQVYYRLANPRMLSALDLIREILCEQLKQEGRLVNELKEGRGGKRRGSRD